MIIDARIGSMMNCAAPANIEPRIVPIGMISFVLMVDVSNEVDATDNFSVFSMKMNTCVIIEVH
jgi:hypothetical protein